MTTRPPFPWNRRIATLGLVAGIIAVLTMVSGPLYRFGLIGLGAAFSGTFLGYWLGQLAALFGVVALLLALARTPRRHVGRALLAIVLGVVAFVPPMLFKHKAGSVPAIHDITTDTTNPPAFQALLAARADAPNPAEYGGAEVAAKQHAAYPDIQPLQFDAPPAKVFPAALETARAMGWDIAAQVPDEGRIEATATTFWFGFKDDVVIRLQPAAGGTRVDVRSESRVGGSDVGANAARIRAYSRKLREALGSH